MLGFGEIWYFLSKTGVFSRIDDFTVVGGVEHCVS
jgi:hypothetical protein